MIRNIYVVLMLLLLSIFTSSCGYKFGSMMHPQVSSIAIGNVINDTTSYNVSVQLQQLLSEAFMLDGSLKVANRRTADCIIFAKIMNVGYREIAGRSIEDDYSPTEWEVRVYIEFSVIIPGEKAPLIKTQTTNGRAIFQAKGDTETARQRALMMACRDAAQNMVHITTESW